MPSPPFNTAVVVGAGAVGRMLGTMLERQSVTVAWFDRVAAEGVAAGDACEPDGALRAAGAAADVIVLALPERTLEKALPAMAAVSRADALVVETASVKTVLEPVKRGALSAREVLGLNPMFAPSVGAHGQAIAVVAQRASTASNAFCAMLEAEGASLVMLDAERHDRMAAAMQALGHAAILTFAAALAQSGESLPELLRIAPPPFRVLASLTARVLGQSRETYWDIQAGNPYAAEMRDHLRTALARLERESCADGLPAFSTWLDAIEDDAGDALKTLQGDCARLFSALPARDSSQTPQHFRTTA